MGLFDCFTRKPEASPPSVFDQLAEYEVQKEKERVEKLGFKRLHRGYDPVMIMAEGNERAEQVLWIVMRSRIDPHTKHQLCLHFVEALDLIGIYGAKIAVLHDVVCGGDVTKTAAVLKAYLLGWVSAADIVAAVADPAKKVIDPDEILANVQSALPGFKL